MDASLAMAASAVLVALVTGYFTWKQSKPKGDADVMAAQSAMQTAVFSGFKMVVNEVRGENARLKEDFASFRQNSQRVESELRMEINALWECVTLQERLMTTHGVQFERFEYRPLSTRQ